MKVKEAAGSTGSPANRICLVTSTFPRWAGDSVPHFVLNLAMDLVDHGWQVDVLAPHFDGAATGEVIDGVRVTRFRYLWPASLETLAYGDGGAIHALRRKPWNIIKLPFFLAAQVISLYRLVKRHRIDVINSHWLLPQGLSCAVVSRLTGVPHVATVHGGDVLGLKSAPFVAIKRWVLGRAAACTTNSSITEAAVRAIAPIELRIERIPPGAIVMPSASEESNRDIRTRFAPRDEKLLLFVGRLIPQKGCSDLLTAMKSIVRIHAEVRLVIAGDGPEMGTLKDQSTALGIADQVEFTGWMNSDELHQLYQAADLFIAAPTRGAGGEVEAFGLVFVEASLAGLPIVATRSGGIVDIVLEGETGLLVDEDEPEQLAAAIQSLLADPGRARQLGAAGRMRAEELFTRERAADDFSALSADLATRRSQ